MNLHDAGPRLAFPWWVIGGETCGPTCYGGDRWGGDHHRCIREATGKGVVYCECPACPLAGDWYHYIEADLTEDNVCGSCKNDDHPMPPR